MASNSAYRSSVGWANSVNRSMTGFDSNPGIAVLPMGFDGDEMILSESQCVLAQACTGLTGVGPRAVSAGDRVQTLSRAAIWKEE
jgi:hypothetical protein